MPKCGFNKVMEITFWHGCYLCRTFKHYIFHYLKISSKVIIFCQQKPLTWAIKSTWAMTSIKNGKIIPNQKTEKTVKTIKNTMKTVAGDSMLKVTMHMYGKHPTKLRKPLQNILRKIPKFQLIFNEFRVFKVNNRNTRRRCEIGIMPAASFSCRYY